MSNVNGQTIYQMGNVVNDVVKQATGRDPVQQINMDFVTVEQNTLMGIETHSGSVVSFVTPKSVPLLTLEAQIVAQQNLHGYEYPWPGGGGKNKFFMESFEYTHQSVEYKYNSSTGRLEVNGTSTSGVGYNVASITVPEGTYTFSADYFNLTGFLQFILRDSSTNENVCMLNQNNTSATIDLNGTYLVRVAVVGDQTVSGYIDKIQLELRSTKTDYAPYSNICPITGFTGCNITVSDGDTTEHVYPVEWETEAGTVYGGVLDAKNGKLTVDRIGYNVTISTSNTARNPTNVEGKYRFAITTSFENVILPETTGGLCGALFDKAKEINANETYNTQGTGMAVRNGTTLIYYNEATAGMTVSEFVSFIGGSIQVILKLTEPVEYEVTPVSINTLAGANVISADTGDISLSYYVYTDLL